jgi:hypothetical protein
MMKISGSGSVGQRHGSADPDPDPRQKVMDPQHCPKKGAISSLSLLCAVVAVPTVMIYFTTYEQVRDLMHCSYAKLSPSPVSWKDGNAPPLWISLSAGKLIRIH